MAGRPSKYQPEFCELVIGLGKDGKSRNQMALACGVDRRTLRDWIEVHPDFAEAYEIALMHAQSWWENFGQTNMVNKFFNANAYNKQIANRFKDEYGDRSQVDLGVTDGVAELLAQLNGKSRGLPSGSK